MNLSYPSDRDGGSMRIAGIKNLERKVAMAKVDGNAAMLAKFESQLAEYRDSTKSPSPSIVLVSRS